MADPIPGNIKCLICGSGQMKKYYYPDVHFNGSVFKYYECDQCYSAQVDPMPSTDDYKEMYGENDHAYLSRLKEGEKINFERVYPKYNHQKYQVDFLNSFDYLKYGNTLLDFGCGSGFYMYHAKKKGFDCTGVEFDPHFAALISEKSGLNIVTKDKIIGRTFDVIHLGHVLEHMENPLETLKELKQFAHPGSIFIIDGPLEKNICLSRFLIKTVSLLKRKKYNTYAPQHITFTNYSSQLKFFEVAGLQTIRYTVAEQMFPLPEHFDIKSPGRAILFLVSRLSILLSKFNKKWGNIFHFSGKFN